MVDIPGWDQICGEHILRAVRTDVIHPLHREANGALLAFEDFLLMVFEAPNDGYRSSAASPFLSRGSVYDIADDMDYIRAPVLVRRWLKSDYGDAADGIELIDRRNGKTILHLGTGNSDDYYPSFVCDWQPANLADNEGGSDAG